MCARALSSPPCYVLCYLKKATVGGNKINKIASNYNRAYLNLNMRVKSTKLRTHVHHCICCMFARVRARVYVLCFEDNKFIFPALSS